MDDTSFLDEHQLRIQDSINVAADFFDLHDIEFNGKKSDLIVINPNHNIPAELLTQNYMCTVNL